MRRLYIALLIFIVLVVCNTLVLLHAKASEVQEKKSNAQMRTMQEKKSPVMQKKQAVVKKEKRQGHLENNKQQHVDVDTNLSSKNTTNNDIVRIQVHSISQSTKIKNAIEVTGVAPNGYRKYIVYGSIPEGMEAIVSKEDIAKICKQIAEESKNGSISLVWSGQVYVLIDEHSPYKEAIRFKHIFVSRLENILPEENTAGNLAIARVYDIPKVQQWDYPIMAVPITPEYLTAPNKVGVIQKSIENDVFPLEGNVFVDDIMAMQSGIPDSYMEKIHEDSIAETQRIAITTYGGKSKDYRDSYTQDYREDSTKGVHLTKGKKEKRSVGVKIAHRNKNIVKESILDSISPKAGSIAIARKSAVQSGKNSQYSTKKQGTHTYKNTQHNKEPILPYSTPHNTVAEHYAILMAEKPKIEKARKKTVEEQYTMLVAEVMKENRALQIQPSARPFIPSNGYSNNYRESFVQQKQQHSVLQRENNIKASKHKTKAIKATLVEKKTIKNLEEKNILTEDTIPMIEANTRILRATVNFPKYEFTPDTKEVIEKRTNTTIQEKQHTKTIESRANAIQHNRKEDVQHLSTTKNTKEISTQRKDISKIKKPISFIDPTVYDATLYGSKKSAVSRKIAPAKKIYRKEKIHKESTDSIEARNKAYREVELLLEFARSGIRIE